MASARPPADRARGFTLIEVLVAFAIAAALLVPLLRIFSDGMGSLARSDRAATASLWAETLLEARGGEALLAAGSESGELPGGYRWTRTVASYSDPAMAQAARPLVPYSVSLTVAWREGVRTREVSLATLRLAPPPRH